MKAEFQLWLHASLNNTKGVETALAAGAKADCSGLRGFSPLHIAAEKDNNEMAALLLDHGACPYRDRDPKHLLVELIGGGAMTKGAYVVVNRLVQRYPDDVTPLEIAADRGNHDFIKMLVPAYHRIRKERSYYREALVNNDFDRAMVRALKRKDGEMFKTLTEAKKDILSYQPPPKPSFVQEIAGRLRAGWRKPVDNAPKPHQPGR